MTEIGELFRWLFPTFKKLKIENFSLRQETSASKSASMWKFNLGMAVEGSMNMKYLNS